ncbi:hypothetical protein [Paraflavitalea speifideaquila]|uniref:hypothetical protein n=1 Tax=Paraflavitalea speifideaquila TaxID=3076558 RepID=UPI0028EA7047|nr:hypothetical protein [Paraflavitalea speifideiaquila]
MADNKIVGRKEEQKILQSRLNTPEAELIALYGRRRVGKTYLIRTYYKEFIAFEFTGAQKPVTKVNWKILGLPSKVPPKVLSRWPIQLPG